ncbi:hypothetical protein FRC15_009267 [Serendipita sp. 397]|nr:hypothetical protein FRC15_009267 [Serendipita sp. 397]
MVLVGSGGVDHQELVKLAEKQFSSLPRSANPTPLGRLAHTKTDFVGSEVRIRDDTMSTCNVAIAVEGVSWSSPDYFPMLVMQSIFGNWDRSLDIGRQVVTSGRRFTPKQIENAIEAVTVEEIKRVARKYLWDKDIALAAYGRVEGLLDYSRIRADMSSMTF